MKTSKVVVEVGKNSHVDSIVGRLRKEDWAEVKAATGEDPDSVLVEAWNTSEYRWAILLDGKAIGVFGVAKTEREDIGVPWLLGTDKMKEIKASFARMCKPYIATMLNKFGSLTNYVDDRNKDSIKWLKWCGFEIGDPYPYGAEGKPFRIFYKREEKNV